MKKRGGKEAKTEVRKLELVLAVVAAVLLIVSLLFQGYFDLSPDIASFFIFLFVIVKIYEISKKKSKVLEEYIALAIIAIFGAIHFVLGQRVNSVIIAVIIFVLAYSVGLVPWVDHIFESRRVTFFIASYGFFVFMILFLFAGIYHSSTNGFNYMGNISSLTFGEALYFSTVTFTTVGYGDIIPLGVNKAIVTVQTLLGMVLNIAFIGYFFASGKIRS